MRQLLQEFREANIFGFLLLFHCVTVTSVRSSTMFSTCSSLFDNDVLEFDATDSNSSCNLRTTHLIRLHTTVSLFRHQHQTQHTQQRNSNNTAASSSRPPPIPSISSSALISSISFHFIISSFNLSFDSIHTRFGNHHNTQFTWSLYFVSSHWHMVSLLTSSDVFIHWRVLLSHITSHLLSTYKISGHSDEGGKGVVNG